MTIQEDHLSIYILDIIYLRYNPFSKRKIVSISYSDIIHRYNIFFKNEEYTERLSEILSFFSTAVNYFNTAFPYFVTSIYII